MKTAEIRQRFLDHFVANGHTLVPSASLIADDPNLLLVNAGMVPFKPYLLGEATPPYRRATSVQKCVRTTDIDEVGKFSRYGSFFQMCGNFSFGDYFKAGAARYAWDLFTRSQADGGYGFDEGKLWVTIYLDDDEAHDVWARQIGVPPERIQRLGKEDNYWDMGVPGPCGPDSEIFIDRGPDYGVGGGPAVGGDRFIELWNLVFMTYERGEGMGKDYPILGDLPAKNIDTGMGLERVATQLQGVDNLYEIDETYPVLERAAELTGTKYGGGGTGAEPSPPDDVRLRIVTDHVRTALMLIADGVTPANEGRGYVLRRIIRRSVRAMRLLGYADRSLPELLPVSRDAMKASYPEVAADFARISDVAYAEEEAFARTLEAGTTILDTAVRQVKSAGGTTLPGDRAFGLHDTYGFPIDLTLEMAGEQGLAVDEDGFRGLMTEQRERAKADARTRKSGHGDVSVYRALRDVGASEFVGYTTLEAASTVRGLVRDGSAVEAAEEGQTVELVLASTPFYAESGGQVADEGVITAGDARLRVLDVQRPVRGLIVHRVQVESGSVGTGEDVKAAVDPEWRLSACQAHSGTHVVHAALREVLGPTALQSGSYNKPGYLRLDFAWRSGLSAQTRQDIEDVSNRALREDLPVSAAYMTLPEAKAIGAIALFGETYDEQVRVVQIGGPWSRELCGGTHVQHSSQVGALTLLGESSVGAGVRRVEAYVGMDALAFLARERSLVAALSDTLKTPAAELPERVEGLVARLREAEKELTTMRAAAVRAQAGQLAEQAHDVFGVAVVTAQAPDGTTAGDLRTLVQDVRGRLDPGRPGVVVAGAEAAGRASLVVGLNQTARQWGMSAAELIRVIGPVIDGKGGGSDDLAQGGGSKPAALGDALRGADDHIAGRVTGSR